MLSETGYALTRSGIYYLDHLYCEFSYFSAMACDTSVSDPTVSAAIADTLQRSLGGPKVPLHARKHMAGLFVGYLQRAEQRELAGAMREHPVLAEVAFIPRMQAALESIPST